MRRLLVLGLVWMLAGCAPRPSGGEEEPRLVSSLQAGAVGDSVEFVFQLTNTTGAPIELVFPSSQSFDLVVRDASGAEVWRWSAERMFAQAVRSQEVAPGETLTYTAHWTPPQGASGRYRVRAELTARGEPVEQRAEFVLP